MTSAVPLTFDNLARVSGNSMGKDGMGRISNQGFTYNQPSMASSDSVGSVSTVSTIKLATTGQAAPTGGADGSSNISTDSKSDEESLAVPPSLLRKKSGELVKSSLRLSSLTKCASSPSLVPSKSVRFASRLANVKMFDGRESPSTVSTCDNTPTGSPQYRDDYFSHKGYFSWGMDDDDEISDITSDTSSDDETTKAPVIKYDVESINLKTTKSICDKQDLPCYLSSLKLNSERSALVGLVMVKNLAFEKHLSVKLTFNKWNSCLIINNANYNKSFQSVNFDQFKFQVPLCNLSKNLNIELVIKYEVGGAVYWDNNNGRNYNIKLKPFTNYSNTIQNYTYKGSDAKFDKLIDKLIDYKNEDFDDDEYIYSRTKTFSPTKQKSELHNRYNITHELDSTDLTTKPREAVLTPPIFSLQSRPSLKQSLSTSDIPVLRPAKYSQSYKSKQKENESIPNSTATKFNSKSYSDLLQTYCFYNGSKTNTSEATIATPSGNNNFTSPASTFHSLSDSIHI